MLHPSIKNIPQHSGTSLVVVTTSADEPVILPMDTTYTGIYPELPPRADRHGYRLERIVLKRAMNSIRRFFGYVLL